jgi:hypothetical protein
MCFPWALPRLLPSAVRADGPTIAGRVAALDFALDLTPDLFASPCDRIEPRGGSLASCSVRHLGLRLVEA